MSLQSWAYLLIAIVAEVVATSALKASASFTRTGPSTIVVVGYGVAFYFLARALETVPVGIAYAIWSGIGILLITVIGWVVFGQALDAAAIIGLALIVAGVVVLNVFSKTVVAH
jgi:small multidrug resistance pump